MKFIVTENFIDTEDKLKTQPKGRLYKKDDKFPATKRKVSGERLEVLLGNNSYKRPFIKKEN